MIELKPFTESDFTRLINWIDSPRFLIQWGAWKFKYPLDNTQLNEYLSETKGETPKRMVFKGIKIGTNEVIGHIELDNINRTNSSASVCRVLVGPPDLKGRGFGSAMVREIVSIGFDQLALHRIDLQVYEFNKAAIACYEKVGFVKEGLLRKYREVDNEYWNLTWMGLLK
jgi:RimJ/RimL family protein N-acetyltransferase